MQQWILVTNTAFSSTSCLPGFLSLKIDRLARWLGWGCCNGQKADLNSDSPYRHLGSGEVAHTYIGMDGAGLANKFDTTII